MKLFNTPLLRRQSASFDVADETIRAAAQIIDGWASSLKSSGLSITKETSVQGPFLTKIFQDCLGYKLQGGGDATYHLIPELSIGQDSADAGLGFYSRNLKTDLAVVELKDAGTSLDKKQLGRARKETPVEQGYRYANKIDSCKWIIVSNFREIRLYSKYRSEDYFESFSLEKLADPSEFKTFYYLLCRQNLIDPSGTSEIDNLLAQSSQYSRNITDQFYDDYSERRLALFDDLVLENPQVAPPVLLEKTQKILDRLIFVCFCEDSSVRLLPTNTVDGIIKSAAQSFEQTGVELWKQCRGLFRAIDRGNLQRIPPINAYNGGLFAQDDQLDALVIRDAVLKPVLELHAYDFHSDLDVNVLGHVFEQSVADIEAIKAELEGTPVAKRSTKQRKEGIYYTPEYLTRYIVEMTLGAYLEEHPDRLETLKVLDPACGSGAFLNQAHTHLKKSYALRRDEIEAAALEQQEQAQLDAQKRRKRSARVAGLFEATKDGIAVRRDLSQEWAYANDAALLRHLFGVDLNEESAEITKLSLWLKTARADEPLENLEKNIKVGNSLIDDPSLAFEKAFTWVEEFPEILSDHAGFDVVIGNPPWGAELPEGPSDYIVRRYPHSSQQHKDTYKHFIELALGLIRPGGYLGFVTPSTLLYQPRYTDVREYLDNYNWTCINLGEKIFPRVNLPCCLILVKKESATKKRRLFNLTEVPRDELHSILASNELAQYAEIDPLLIMSNAAVVPLDKVLLMKDAGVKHQRVGVGLVNKGKTDLRQRLYSLEPEADTYPLLTGSDINRYSSPSMVSLYLRKNYKSVLRDNEIVYFDEAMMRAGEKLLWRQTADKIRATLAKDQWFANTVQGAIIREEYKDKVDPYFVLGVLNSSLYEKLYRQKVLESGRLFPQVKLSYLKELPFIVADAQTQRTVRDAVKEVMRLTDDFANLAARTGAFLFRRYNVKVKGLPDGAQLAAAVKKRNRLTIPETEEFLEWYTDRLGEIERTQAAIATNEALIDAEVNKLFSVAQL